MSLKKEKYSPRIIQTIRKDLMVKPVTLRQFSQCVQSFQVYLESINKLYIPKYYGLKKLGEPDIFKIEAMIDKIVNQRIEDGQLDECPLTLDELNRIKGTVDGNSGMLPVLRGIYHIRVEYPDEPKTASSA